MCNSSAHAGYGPSSAQDTGNLDFTTGQLREWRLKSPIYRQLLSKHGVAACEESKFDADHTYCAHIQTKIPPEAVKSLAPGRARVFVA